MALDNSGLARNTCAAKNFHAANTRAAACSLGYRRKARCHFAVKVHRNARCSLAPKSRCCLAGRRCRPRADDSW